MIPFLNNESTPMGKEKAVVSTLVSVHGLLYRKPNGKYSTHRIVLSDKMFDRLYELEHNSPHGGHFSTEKTYYNMSRCFWHPNFISKIQERIRSCLKCSQNKATNIKYSIPGIKPIGLQPMEIVELEVQEPLPLSSSGNRFILTHRFVVKIYLHQGYKEPKDFDRYQVSIGYLQH